MMGYVIIERGGTMIADCMHDIAFRDKAHDIAAPISDS
jgi:hypothetical protein